MFCIACLKEMGVLAKRSFRRRMNMRVRRLMRKFVGRKDRNFVKHLDGTPLFKILDPPLWRDRW